MRLSLPQFLRSPLRTLRSLRSKSVGSPLTQWLRGDDEFSGVALQPRTHVWIYSCVQALADNVANTPLRAWSGTKTQSNLVADHPILQLMARPHPDLDCHNFLTLLVHWLQHRGVAYVVARDTAGHPIALPDIRSAAARRSGIKVASLVVLPTDRVTLIRTQGGLAGYRFSEDTTVPMGTYALLPEEVIAIRFTDPSDYWGGLAPVTAALLAATTDHAAALFLKGLAEANGDLGLIASTDQSVGEEQQQQVIAALRARKRGQGVADRPLILGYGFKVERPNLKSADLELLAGRKFSRQEICAALRVPESVLGIVEDVNKANGENVRLSWTENVLAPFCNRLASGLQPMFAAMDPNVEVAFDIDSLPVMQAARRTRIDAAQKAFAIGVPLNVALEVYATGIPSVPGTGDIAYLPTTFLPATLVGQQPAPDPAANLRASAPPREKNEAGTKKPEHTHSPLPGAPEDRLLAALTTLATGPSHRTITTPPTESDNSDQWTQSIGGHVAQVRGTLQRVMWDQRRRVLAALEAAYKKTHQVEDARQAPIRDIREIRGSQRIKALEAQHDIHGQVTTYAVIYEDADPSPQTPNP